MDIIIVVYIFTGLYIFFCISTILLFNKVLKLKEKLKFQQQLMYKLNEITRLEDLNDTQLLLRNNLLMIFANGDIQKFKQLDKEYDIHKTKKLFYKHLEPIE